MNKGYETRKLIAQRAIDRANSRGAPIDRDPDFVALLDEWVRGDIDMKDMRERYLDILALQEAERRERQRRSGSAGPCRIAPASSVDDQKEKGPSE